MGKSKQTVAGGSFAPPLDAATVARYRDLAVDADDKATESYILQLCDMVDLFLETPASPLPGTPHPSGRGTITPLEDGEMRRIYNAVPWSHECDMMGRVFSGLDPVARRDVRNAAFHLLWYARELTIDRQPITTDRLEA